MPEVTSYKTGQFCWAELMTSDQEAAKGFYSSLFGYEAADQEIPGGGTYTLLRINGLDAAGLGTLQEGDPSPPHWNSYICVDDADGYAKKAEAAGGKPLMEPFDVMDQGRMTFVQDPAGAFFGIWQPKSNIGSRITGESGTVVWNELVTSGTDEAQAFYADVFGWKPESWAMKATTDERPYTLFKLDDESVGGMVPPPSPAEAPPFWLIYFGTSDAAASTAKVKELGGQVFMEPFFVEGVGTLAMLADPQGAGFAVLEADPNIVQ